MPKIKDDALERVRILEKAVANLGDTLKKRDREYDEELHDILTELKALKLFLSRTVPEFKKQFPEIQRKVR
jgi:hypothetical protein